MHIPIFSASLMLKTQRSNCKDSAFAKSSVKQDHGPNSGVRARDLENALFVTGVFRLERSRYRILIHRRCVHRLLALLTADGHSKERQRKLKFRSLLSSKLSHANKHALEQYGFRQEFLIYTRIGNKLPEGYFIFRATGTTGLVGLSSSGPTAP